MEHMSPKKLRALACAGLLVVALLALAACGQQQQQQSSAPSEKAALSTDSDVAMLVVPNVVSLTLPDAEKSIVSAGFKLGEVSYENSDTVPTGNVISQSPEALSGGAKDKTVTLVVSLGKAAPKMIKVPDVRGLSQAKAEQELSGAGLIGVCDGWVESTEADPGKVFKQSVEAGTEVAEGTKVAFTIAMAPSQATVPNLIGMDEKTAEKALDDAKLSFDIVKKHSDKVDAGLVMAQSYDAGTEVSCGTTVTVTLSLGPKPAEKVEVPNVITYSWSDAEATLESAGLVARYTGDPSGVVVDQDIDAGEKVDPGTMVTLTLSEPTQQVKVPNLVGVSVSVAENITDSLGLSLDGANDGIVVEQKPAPGTMVDEDTTVYIKAEADDDDDDDSDNGKEAAKGGGAAAGDVDASQGASKVEVPDLVGMSPEDAAKVAKDQGLSLDGATGDEGSVVEQKPKPGTWVKAGDTISVKVDPNTEPTAEAPEVE